MNNWMVETEVKMIDLIAMTIISRVLFALTCAGRAKDAFEKVYGEDTLEVFIREAYVNSNTLGTLQMKRRMKRAIKKVRELGYQASMDGNEGAWHAAEAVHRALYCAMWAGLDEEKSAYGALDASILSKWAQKEHTGTDRYEVLAQREGMQLSY